MFLFGAKEPRIDLTKPPYDQSTFDGRLRHFVRLTSPLTLFASQTQLQHAQNLVNAYINRKPLPARLDDYNRSFYSESELWKAKYLVESSIHPDTHEPIFVPFRMSCFVPTNLLVTAGLLIPNPSLKTLVFWQWLNQSVNVGTFAIYRYDII